jgi:hypothetical protein
MTMPRPALYRDETAETPSMVSNSSSAFLSKRNQDRLHKLIAMPVPVSVQVSHWGYVNVLQKSQATPEKCANLHGP